MRPPRQPGSAPCGRVPLAEVLGPGLITGASDDDPSGIATYTQAGARFGFELGWTLVLTYPLMVVTQEISARIGRVTGRGIAGNIRTHYSPATLRAVAALLCLANTVNIGADLGAMAEATRLLLPLLPLGLGVALFGLGCALAPLLVNHRRYVSLLKWLTLALFAYFAVLFTVHVPWHEALRGMLWPRWSSGAAFWQMVVAVLGTTISPYMLFWQAALEVEDTRAAQRPPLRRAPRQGPAVLARIRLDTVLGMALSNLVGLAILVTAATTLRPHGLTDIKSAADAAQALRPLAGHFAFAVFALGILGTGLLAVPVLAASAAYTLGEACMWPVGMSRRLSQAKGFYATIAATTLIGALANLLPLDAMSALIWAAVINGLVAVPVMAVVVRMARDERIMGEFVVSRGAMLVGLLTTGVMALAALGMIWGALSGA
jgi:NRAMP (natural resistance-associated macrophage protein)-like metal ion transporter